MVIRLISVDNGVGLTRDTAILKRILTTWGHEVHFCSWQSKDHIGKVDLNIYLELISPKQFRLARANIYIPNPEWFEKYFIQYISSMRVILAKTKDCERIFRARHNNVIYTGFTSEDLFDTAEKTFTFAHFCGQSTGKGTDQVILAFRKPNMPALNLYSIARRNVNETIKGVYGRQPNDVHRYNMNRHLIHLCTSTYEGFGHYMNEAKSCGAAIITTNAEPMNELVTSDYGFGVEVSHTGEQKLAKLNYPNPDSIEKMVRLVSELDYEMLIGLGQKARKSFLDNDAAFKERFKNVISHYA